MKKFTNFTSHLEVLSQAEKQDLTNAFILSGIIDKFFLQFELGWKVFKELLKYEGKAAGATGSPREIIKAAYGIYGFMEETLWLDMLKDRNDLTHIYDGDQAEQLVHRILNDYLPEFLKMREALTAIYGNQLDQI